MIKIHKNYPGGNIRVNNIKGNIVNLEQEIRDTTLWWFYWGFCIDSPPEGELIFNFTNGDVVGPQGPAVSNDRAEWKWLGEKSVISRSSFKCTFDGTEEQVFFCISFPYQLSDFDRFYKRHNIHPMLIQTDLALSEEGRRVPLLRIGDKAANKNIILTCRHHACESIASYVLEGVIDFYLREESGEILSEFAFYVIPFMDIDGVENGDQGKCRHPHDHGDDYRNDNIYKSTSALMSLASELKPVVYLDFHCPWIWAYGKMRDEHPFFGKGPSPMKERIEKLGNLLKKATLQNADSGSILYDPAYDIETGEDWMTPEEMENSASTYFSKSDVNLSAFIEIPYFHAGDRVITQKNAGKFGIAFGIALKEYLKMN